jgi:thioredoxin reductase
MPEERTYDCIIVGAGSGGLEAAIYFGRHNRDVLLIFGPVNTGHDQAIIAAGEGAVAAIEINKRLLNI